MEFWALKYFCFYKYCTFTARQHWMTLVSCILQHHQHFNEGSDINWHFHMFLLIIDKISTTAWHSIRKNTEFWVLLTLRQFNHFLEIFWNTGFKHTYIITIKLLVRNKCKTFPQVLLKHFFNFLTWYFYFNFVYIGTFLMQFLHQISTKDLLFCILLPLQTKSVTWKSNLNIVSITLRLINTWLKVWIHVWQREVGGILS